MKLFTAGQLHVSGVGLSTDVSIEDFVTKLAERPYGGTPPTHGWGGVPYGFWSGEGDDMPPKPSRTQHHESPARLSLPDGTEVALARYFYDRRDLSFVRKVGRESAKGMSPEYTYLFDAVDVMAIEELDGFTLYVGSRDPNQVDPLIRDLVSDLGLQGADPVVENPVTALTPSRDLFLWLMLRWATDAKLADDLILTEYRSVSATDGIQAETRVLKYVSLDRDEVLALVSHPLSQFGPAKFALFDTTLSFQVDLFLLLDGRYEVIVSESFVAEDAGVGEKLAELRRATPPGASDSDAEESLRPARPTFGWPGRADFGVEAVYNVSEVVLPKLYRAHAADQEWSSTKRKEFRRDAGDRLVKRIQGREPKET